MTRTHYEVLQVSPGASPAEIRTAYRAACLRTHPDKAKPEDKKKAEYEFRRVQQAYEVLSDEETRKAYDYQRTRPASDGMFQQQQQQQQQQYQQQNAGEWLHPFGASASSSPFNHPFFNDGLFSRPFGFGQPPFASFGWPFGGGRDPFEDMMSSHRRMADELSRMAAAHPFAGFPRPPVGPSRAGDASASTSMFTSTSPGTSTSARQPSSRSNSAAMWSFMGSRNANSGGGRWISESHSESWVNGQRHSTHKRRDLNGVEHVTHTYPDGTTRSFVNGVEREPPQAQAQAQARAVDRPGHAADRGTTTTNDHH